MTLDEVFNAGGGKLPFQAFDIVCSTRIICFTLKDKLGNFISTSGLSHSKYGRGWEIVSAVNASTSAKWKTIQEVFEEAGRKFPFKIKVERGDGSALEDSCTIRSRDAQGLWITDGGSWFGHGPMFMLDASEASVCLRTKVKCNCPYDNFIRLGIGCINKDHE